jgi:RNA polymerase sigma-70 factor, ECF subfamily
LSLGITFPGRFQHFSVTFYAFPTFPYNINRISSVASKDSTAEFIQLLTSNQSRLFAYLLSLLGNRQQAEDVMQETNMILWRKASQFQLGTNFNAWMFKIAYYQVLDHRRKRNKQALFIQNDEFLAELADTAATTSDIMDRQQDALRLCLDKLPERQRDIVRRRYSDGESIKSVAQQIGVAASAVKQTLFRARVSLIDCVHHRLKEQII